VVLVVLEVLAVLVVEEAGLQVAGDLRLNDCTELDVEMFLEIKVCATGKGCG
jgi:hypothetical protein